MAQLSAKAPRSASSTAWRLRTGNAPGSARHTGQTFVLGGAPNASAQPQKILVRVPSWQCTSSPITGSYFAICSGEASSIEAAIMGSSSGYPGGARLRFRGEETDDYITNRRRERGARNRQNPRAHNLASLAPANGLAPVRGTHARDGACDGVGRGNGQAKGGREEDGNRRAGFRADGPPGIQARQPGALGFDNAPSAAHCAQCNGDAGGHDYPGLNMASLLKMRGDQKRREDAHCFLSIVRSVSATE